MSTGFARSLIIEAVTPPPETDLGKSVLTLPGWLIALLLLVKGRKPQDTARSWRLPRSRCHIGFWTPGEISPPADLGGLFCRLPA